MGEISDALRRAREGIRGGLEDRPRSSASVRRATSTATGSGAEPRSASPILEVGGSVTAGRAGHIVVADPRSEVAEAFRQSAVRVLRTLRARNARSLVVTSAASSEGKTTTSCNLALALASLSGGRRIVLLDLDLRRPRAGQALGVRPAVGIDRVLRGKASLADACARTQFPDLDACLVTTHAKDALTLISSPELKRVLAELAHLYEIVLIDSPPVLHVPDVSVLAPIVDAVLLVARSGVSRMAALRDAVETIGREKLLGVFVNGERAPGYRRYEGYYHAEDEVTEEPT